MKARKLSGAPLARLTFPSVTWVGLAALLLVCPLATRGQEQTFVYQGGPELPAFEVTADGLSAIRLGGRVVASGAWLASDAQTFLDPAAAKAEPWTFPRRRLETVGPAHARVHHDGDLAACVTDYLFDGEDVEIRSRVENRAPERILPGLAVGGLVFTFSRPPDGLAMQMAPDVMPRLGHERYHPSFHNPFGGSYLTDGTVGVGATALRNGWLPTVLWWPVPTRTQPTARPFHYLRALDVPPGSAVRVDCALRVSANPDWRHLLEPYRAHFRQTYGPVRYRADFRPFGSCQLSSERWREEGNPYGFLRWWRFDREEGVAKFTADVVAALRRANAQGVLVWAHGGDHPRGCNFRPDFDVLPPEVDRLIPALTAPFHEAGLRLGVLARPQIVTPATWTSDTVVNLAPADPTQMAMVARRFDNLMARGVTAFYIDTFGSAPGDARAMLALREGWRKWADPATRPPAFVPLPDRADEPHTAPPPAPGGAAATDSPPPADPLVDGLLAETDDDTPPPAPEPAYAPDALLGNLLVFTEFWSDVSLVYGGGYAQYAWDPKTRQYREFWRREHLWEACRWLTPGVQLISPGSIVAPYQELPPPPKAPAELAEALVGPPGEPDVAAETLDDAPAAAADGKVITPPDMFRFLMERGITPHFHAGTRTTPDMADRLKALCDEMLDDQGQWRE